MFQMACSQCGSGTANRMRSFPPGNDLVADSLTTSRGCVRVLVTSGLVIGTRGLVATTPGLTTGAGFVGGVGVVLCEPFVVGLAAEAASVGAAGLAEFGLGVARVRVGATLLLAAVLAADFRAALAAPFAGRVIRVAAGLGLVTFAAAFTTGLASAFVFVPLPALEDRDS